MKILIILVVLVFKMEIISKLNVVLQLCAIQFQDIFQDINIKYEVVKKDIFLELTTHISNNIIKNESSCNTTKDWNGRYDYIFAIYSRYCKKIQYKNFYFSCFFEIDYIIFEELFCFPFH